MRINPLPRHCPSALLGVLVLPLFLLAAACNSPPLYTLRSEEFLTQEGVEPDLIQRLRSYQPLTEEEAERLLAFDFVPVTHLVASNTSVPESVLRRLAQHPDFEVRTGIAVNEAVPLPVLLELRTPGKYTTVGCMLARNARLPGEILLEMEAEGEATLGCFAYNRCLPRPLMEKLAERGDSTAKAGLAINPGLAPDLHARLARSEDRIVRTYAESNPAYRQQAPVEPGPCPAASGP